MPNYILAFLEAQPSAYYVGAALIMLFQADKFNKLNLGIPELSKYREFLSGVGARDLASAARYWIGWGAFCFTSLMVYTGICSISPKAASGLLLLLQSNIKIDSSIPYQLYVATIFLGLTQPVLPGLEAFAEAQRDFFQAGINVPKRVIRQAEMIIAQLQASGRGRDGLALDSIQSSRSNPASFLTRSSSISVSSRSNSRPTKTENSRNISKRCRTARCCRWPEI
jgi:hypothetical protein